MQRFWVEEEVATPSKPSITEEEAQCEQHFAETHSHTAKGRYIVRIPLKQPVVDLGNSYSPALVALNRQERRFTTNPSLKAAYSKFLSEYETLGHMARISDCTASTRRVFYLLHHAVVRESRSTTKVRVVFFGSSRINFRISVIDVQHVGPKLQTNLADVITRWRQYAFVADIEKMYRQILIHEDDRDLQRILWRENQEAPPIAYCLNTVTYGLASAPYVAIRALRQLSIDEHHQYPLATDVI